MSALSMVQNPPEDPKVLNPVVTYDPHKMVVSNTRWSRVWQVAALVTAAFFTALATAVIIYSTLHFPIHLPTVSILVFLGGLPTSFRAFKYFWDKSDYYAAEAAIDKKLITHMDNIPADLGVQPGIEKDKLKSVYARYAYFQAEKDRYLDLHEKITKEPLPSINLVDFKDEKAVEAYRNALKNRVNAMDLYRNAAIAQLQSAYFLHLIQNPYENRKIEKFFTFIPLRTPERLAAKEFGDDCADWLIEMDKFYYTAIALLVDTPQKLMEDIFEANPPVFA
ncbi:MAG: hypothetical protein KR126chlam3_00131 [Chlamydiae bacterium]|nr:hypothetical protein [Chlamydiota bacterium]